MPDDASGSTPAGNDTDDGQEVVFSSAEEAARAAARANGSDNGSERDADGLVVLATEDGDAPPAETPEDETPEDEEPPEYRNALRKYGGDKAKLGRSFWDAQTRAAEATRRANEAERRLEELERRAASPAAIDDTDTTPADDADPDLAADLEWHTAGIQATRTEIQAHQREQHLITNQILPKLRDSIVKAETKLELTAEDDPKRSNYELALQRAIEAHNAKVDEWKSVEKEIGRGARELRDLERNKSRIERDLARSAQSATRAKQEVRQFKESQSREFGTLATEAFAISGLPEEETDRFRSILKRQVVGQLDEIVHRHGPNAPAVDLRELVMSEAEALTSLMGRSGARAATDASRRKAANNANLRGNGNARSGVSRTSDQPAAPSGAPQRYVSPEEEAANAKREARKQMGLVG